MALYDYKTLRYYSENAPMLKERYDKCVGGITELATKAFGEPAYTKMILDIGCGTGRDVSILLKMGYNAYGLEASPEMISVSDSDITSRLALGSIVNQHIFKNPQYYGILCSAVLMHIPDCFIDLVIKNVNKLLRMNGNALISVPLNRPDVVNQRDRDGRLFILRTEDEWIKLFLKSGFELIYKSSQDDGLARKDLSWLNLIFKRVQNG